MWLSGRYLQLHSPSWADDWHTVQASRRGLPCRYCGVRSNLTIDHVRPTSKGGDWSWENLVTACVKCNGKKGDSTLKQLGWKLKKQPQVCARLSVCPCLMP